MKTMIMIGELTKVGSFASKGGGVEAKFQFPKSTAENMVSNELLAYSNQQCRVTLEFSDLPKDDEEAQDNLFEEEE